MNVARQIQNMNDSYSDINVPMTASVVGHIVALILIIFGIPFIAKDPTMLLEPIPVEIVSAGDIKESATPVVKEEPVKAEPAPEPKPEPTPAPTPQPAPATEEMVKAEEPEAVPPPPSEMVKAEELTDAPKPDVKMAPTPIAKPKPPVKTVAPEEPKKEVVEKKDNKDALASLLKNLNQVEETPPTPKVEQPNPAPAQNASRFSGQQLSMSEQNAVKEGLRPCWYFDSGAAYAEKLIVDLAITMNPDRTVRSVEIVDQGRYRSDTFFRAAADAARRAVRNPQCSPLQLPPEKYEEWKTITLTFDPSKML